MFNIDDFNRHVTKIEVDGLTGYKCNKGAWVVQLQQNEYSASFEAYTHFQEHFIDGEYHPDLKELSWLTRFFNWLTL